MTRESRIWLILFVLGGLGLLAKGTLTDAGLGKVYVKPARLNSDQSPLTWTKAKPGDDQAELSVSRTIGLWVAAFLTLAIFSYLYRDNVIYKLAEALIVGVSAGYYLVTNFWDSIVAQLMVELTPSLVRTWTLPSLAPDKTPDYWFLVPLILGVLLFSRFVPGAGWLARWPLAFVVGTFAGLRLVLFLDADFISQIRNTMLPLIVMNNGSFAFWPSVRNILLMLSLLASLSYFYFSIPHRGAWGASARVGIWVLMITFGASFAFTVMGRITLLTKQLEFLFGDWLRIIPT